jgi:hypothetical protein
MGLEHEADWIAEFLYGRTLSVKENGVESSVYLLEIGAPQGSVLGPLLWSILIDPLIRELELACANGTPGEVSLPVVFADDINILIRGFNPSAMIKKANALMQIVRCWAARNQIPMAKMQAIWITKSNIINSAIKRAVEKAEAKDAENMKNNNNNKESINKNNKTHYIS